MMLPYASYLRVYERTPGPVAVDPPGQVRGSAAESAGSLMLAREQQTVLQRTIVPVMREFASDPAGCYVLQRDGQIYVCGVDLALRAWLALATFVEDTDPATQTLLGLPNSTNAETSPDQTEATGLTAVPHIRVATWGVPRTWFLLVAERERETYDAGSATSVRFRTPITTARRRLAAAQMVLADVIDDDDLGDELDDLRGWLASFPGDSWVEVDYAGVATLLGPDLARDRSAGDIATALDALQARDFPRAAVAYRSFMERWRVVSALERAN